MSFFEGSKTHIFGCPSQFSMTKCWNSSQKIPLFNTFSKTKILNLFKNHENCLHIQLLSQLSMFQSRFIAV